MAIEYVGTGAQADVAGNSCSPALPAGWTAGDFALCFAVSRGTSVTLNDVTTPNTWTGLTQISKTTSLRTRIYWRYLQAGDGAPRVTSTVSQCFLAFVTAFRGVDTSTPFDVPHVVNSGTAVNSAMHTAAITTSKYGDMMLWYFTSGDDNCHTTPSCGTAAAQGASYDSTTGADAAQSLFYQRFYLPTTNQSNVAKQNSNGGDDYIAVTLALQAADPHYLRASQDRLFMKESRIAEQLHVFIDGVLFGAQTKNVLWDGVLRDLMFLYDVSSTALVGGGGPVEVTRAVTDYLFLFDLRTQKVIDHAQPPDKMLLGEVRSAVRELFAARDGLLMRDYGMRAMEHRETQGIMAYDRRQSDQEHALRDAPLLGDRRQSDQEHRLPADNLSVKDFGARAIEELQRDYALLRDQQYRETLRALLDKVLVAERLQREQGKIVREAALLRDYRGATDQEHRTGADQLFLKDTATIEKGKFLAFLDGLYLRDDAARDLSHWLGDKLLVKDTRMTLMERRIAEAVLLGDMAVRLLERLIREGLHLSESLDMAKTGVVIRYIVDYLLLYDSVALGVPVAQINMTDKLLLGDRTLRDISRQLIEGLLIKDYRAPAVLQAIKTDRLLTSDGVLKVWESRKLDLALLGEASAYSKTVARDVLDKLMLLDRRFADRDLRKQDVVLLREVINRVRELLQREGLFTNDAGMTAWYPYLMEYLVYARTAVLRLLGVESQGIDYMGRKLSTRDFLGRTMSVTKSRVN